MKNSKSIWQIMIGILLVCGTTCLAQKLPSSKVTMNEFPELNFSVTGPVFQLDQQWKYIEDDKKEYASPNLDDSKWETINVGKPKFGGEWSWYRLTFDLPKHLENRDLLLHLGRISVYDEVYVNGEKVGNFGNPPPSLVFGASDVWRKYPIKALHFHSGKNVLAIRVLLGSKGGLYEGDYTLQALSKNTIVARLNQKMEGANALRTLLTKTDYLNAFAPGEKLIIAPELCKLFGVSVQGMLSIKLLDNTGQIYVEDAVQIALEPMYWTRAEFSILAPLNEGNYHCHLVYSIDGEVHWIEDVPFRITCFTSLNFALPVDLSLKAFHKTPLPVQISSSAMGQFGPRDSHNVNGKLELFDDLTRTDSRSGLAYSAQFMQSLGAPRLFIANTREVPKDPGCIGRLHRAAGYNFDGMLDVWSYGFVRPSSVGSITSLYIKNTSWAKRTHHYEYKNQDWMEFSISAISPAWMATSNVQKMCVLEGIEKHGIGLPTYLAYERNGKVKVVDSKKGICGSDMSANWVLAWFNGGDGWDEFDTPYLFVLQKRPDLVQCYSKTALFFSALNGDSVGTIQGMPLFGMTLQRPDQTVDWKDGIPADVVERCRYWSRVLVNSPDQVKRTAQLDYAKDQLTVKDEFTYLNIQDDWKTQGMKIAPISPILALTAHTGNIDIAVNEPTKDLHMATLQGPLCAVDNAEKIVFRINGILHYIREVRDVQITRASYIKDTQAELNQLVRKWLDKELRDHPWNSNIRSGKLEPGAQRLRYTGLILTLPYLEPSLRTEVEKEIRTETEKYFLYTGLPDAPLKIKLSPRYQDISVNSIVTNSYTGQQLAVTALGKRILLSINLILQRLISI